MPPTWASEPPGSLASDGASVFPAPATLKFPANGFFTDAVRLTLAQWRFSLEALPPEGLIVGVSTRSRVKPGVHMRMLGLASTGELHNGVEPGVPNYCRPLEPGDQIDVLVSAEKKAAAVWFALNGINLGLAFELASAAENVCSEGLLPAISFWGAAGRVSIARSPAAPALPLEDQWKLLALQNQDATAEQAALVLTIARPRLEEPPDKPEDKPLEKPSEKPPDSPPVKSRVKSPDEPALSAITLAAGSFRKEWTAPLGDAQLQGQVRQAIAECIQQKKSGVTKKPVRKVGGGRYSMR